jgi:hypothetical protein
MSPGAREKWFADLLRAGLETGVLSEPDILAHAPPPVLIGSLPKDVVVRLLDVTLTSGAMSPQAVVQTLTPELLAAHVPAPVIWGCLAAAAQRAGFAGDGVPEGSGAREFLRRALESALTHGIATPKDVVEDVNASVIGLFPDALTTKLLEASLAAGKMNPEVILETLGAEAIAKHAPTHVVWASRARTGSPREQLASAPVAPAAPTASTPPAPPPRRPALEVIEDDLGDPSVSMEVTQDKEDPALATVAGTIDEKKQQGGGGRAGKRA